MTVKKIRQLSISALSVFLILICFSFSVAAAKTAVGTVSKLKATSTATTVTLKWAKAKNAKGYQVAVKSGKKWKTVATVSSTTCRIDSLKAGKNYTYRIKAYGKNGKKKVWANKTKNISVLTAPKKVSSFKATVSGTTATLKWKKTSGAKGYKVYQYNTAKKKWIAIKSTTALKTTVKNLEAGKTYQFAVKAYAKSGKTTTLSTTYSKTSVTVKPDNITNLKITGKTDSSISLSWSRAKGATAYAVYKYDSKNKKWSALISSTTSTSATVGKLSANTSYTLAVRALTKSGKNTCYSSKYVQITATTDKKGAIPSTKAEIAAAYNKAVNNFKAYKGHVTMHKTEKTELAYGNIPAIANKVMDIIFKNYLTDTEEAYTFRNRADVTEPGRKITDKIIPISRNATVTAADLSSATAKRNSDGGYTMTLIFPTEKLKYANDAYEKNPTKIKKAMDYLDLTAMDLGPVSIKSCNMEYRGTTVKATIDSKGRLTYLEAFNSIYGDWSGKAVITITSSISGAWATKYTMNYDSNTAIKPGASLTVPVYTTFPTTNAPQTTEDPSLTEPTTEDSDDSSDIATTTAPYTTEAETTGADFENIPMSKSEIAAAYNKAVNDIKNYNGFVNIKKFKNIPINLTDLSEPAVLSVLNNIIIRFANSTFEEYNFDNGRDIADPGRNLTDKIVPIGRYADVKAEGLSSATTTANADGGYTLVLRLIPEKSVFNGTFNTAEAIYHSDAMDVPYLGTLDLSPLKIYSAETQYPGAELTATVDGQGRLISLTQNLPFCIDGEGEVVSIGCEANIEGCIDLSYEFAYESSEQTTTMATTLPSATTNNYTTTQG